MLLRSGTEARSITRLPHLISGNYQHHPANITFQYPFASCQEGFQSKKKAATPHHAFSFATVALPYQTRAIYGTYNVNHNRRSHVETLHRFHRFHFGIFRDCERPNIPQRKSQPKGYQWLAKETTARGARRKEKDRVPKAPSRKRCQKPGGPV